MARVVVYGTLLPGQPRWPALAAFADGWQPATVAGSLWDTGLGYPAARFDGGAPGAVPGVLVTVAADHYEQVVALLDEIEEEGVLYRRVAVATSAGPAVAYEWLGPVDGLAVLADGWLPGRPAK